MDYYDPHRHSLSASSASSGHSSRQMRSMWSKLTDLFQRHSRYGSRRSSTSTCSTDRRSSAISSDDGQRHRPRRKLVEDCTGMTTIPPYSPTYCKPNEFPYSNFYVKLPNGKWMVRYRSGNRDILGTDEFAGYMI